MRPSSTSSGETPCWRRQFKSLLSVYLKQKARSPSVLLNELLSPLYFIAILIVVKFAIGDEYFPAQNSTAFPLSSPSSFLCLFSANSSSSCPPFSNDPFQLPQNRSRLLFVVPDVGPAVGVAVEAAKDLNATAAAEGSKWSVVPFPNEENVWRSLSFLSSTFRFLFFYFRFYDSIFFCIYTCVFFCLLVGSSTRFRHCSHVSFFCLTDLFHRKVLELFFFSL